MVFVLHRIKRTNDLILYLYPYSVFSFLSVYILFLAIILLAVGVAGFALMRTQGFAWCAGKVISTRQPSVLSTLTARSITDFSRSPICTGAITEMEWMAPAVSLAKVYQSFRSIRL
jgi:hypothetical protein